MADRTGPEHFRQAEEYRAQAMHERDKGSETFLTRMALAQYHATMAQTVLLADVLAATAAPSSDFRALRKWREVMEVQSP